MLQGILQRAVEWERIQGNPVKAVRKPRPERRRAVRPLTPAVVEGVRAVLLAEGRLGDATLVSDPCWPTPGCGRRRRSRFNGGTCAAGRS
jgi:hypothetical protein